jgi:hypothetical protein
MGGGLRIFKLTLRDGEDQEDMGNARWDRTIQNREERTSAII